MKIKIKNIFVNKKQIKKETNEKSNITLKKVYDVNDLKENRNEDICFEETENKVTRKRKGCAKTEDDKEYKFKLYYQNLVKNKNNLSRGYYVLLLFMVFLGAGSVILASKTYKLFANENYQVFNNVENESKDETVSAINKEEKTEELNLQSIETSNKDTIDEFIEKETEKKESTTKKNTESTSKKNEIKVIPLSFCKPIEGEILKVYSPDKVIYSKTLELWKVHDGIDIKAEEGTYVKSIERGTVEKIYQDSFLGTTIVIDHGQGYKSSYSNLDNTTLVKAKQSVKKGEKIAKIGKTSIGEIKDEAHLHFMLYKNNESEDPSSIFK